MDECEHGLGTMKPLTRRRLVIAVAVVTLMAVVATMVVALSRARKSVDVELLLATSLPAPSVVPSDQWTAISTTVRQDDPLFVRTNRARTWSLVTDSQDSVGIVRQTVFSYRETLTSRLSYWREWSRIENYRDYAHTAPAEPYVSKNADQSNLICLSQSRDPMSCEMWIFLARYGQYVVELRYVYEPIDEADFKRIVSGMENEIEVALSNGA